RRGGRSPGGRSGGGGSSSGATAPLGGPLGPPGATPPGGGGKASPGRAPPPRAAAPAPPGSRPHTPPAERESAIQPAREAGAPAVIGSVAFDRMADEDDVRTMMGVSPEQAAEFMAARGCDVAGLNCGTGVDTGMAASIVRRYRASCGLPAMAQPNAGQPVLENMMVLYQETPEQMAERRRQAPRPGGP